MTEKTVFDAFKEGTYKATVRQGNTDIAIYNVTVIYNPDIIGLRQMNLNYTPNSNKLFGDNDYKNVKRILNEQFLQSTDLSNNQPQPIYDIISFSGDNGERIGKRYIVNPKKTDQSNNNVQDVDSILFSKNINGNIERTFIGTSSDNYTIVYEAQPNIRPPENRYKLLYNLIAWVTLFFSFFIMILASIKTYKDKSGEGKISASIIFLSTIIFVFVLGTFVQIIY
jgi:hypothetical protein